MTACTYKNISQVWRGASCERLGSGVIVGALPKWRELQECGREWRVRAKDRYITTTWAHTEPTNPRPGHIRIPRAPRVSYWSRLPFSPSLALTKRSLNLDAEITVSQPTVKQQVWYQLLSISKVGTTLWSRVLMLMYVQILNGP